MLQPKSFLLLLGLLFLFPVLTLTAQQDDLQDFVDTLTSSDDPALVILVELPNDRFVITSGLANIEEGIPVNPGDRFRIGSVTKTFIGVLMLQLQEDDQLSLNDTLDDWLDVDIPYSDVITLEQLLNHTSGIVSYTDADAYFDIVDSQPNYPWSAEDTVETVYGLPADFEPGTDFYYSNTNYNLAQMVIEAATGDPLAVTLNEYIFQPVGMPDSYLEDPNNLANGIIAGYDDPFEEGDLINVGLSNDGQGLGDGGIISTADDLAAFFRALIEGELLSDDSLDMFLDGVETGDGETYGLGISIVEEDWGSVYYHDGATNGFQSMLLYDEDADGIVVMLTNNFVSEVVDYDTALEILDIILLED